MQIQVNSGDIAQFQAEAVIINLFEGVQQPGGGTGAVDQALGGVIADELKASRTFKGKLGETLVLHTHGKIPARYVIVVGLGKSEDLKGFNLRRASASAIKACKKLKITSAATLLHGAGIGGFDVEVAARLLAEGAHLGAYEFTLRKSKKEDDEAPVELKTLTIVEQDASKLDTVKAGALRGEWLALHTNLARDWANDAGNHVTPTFLKDQAEVFANLTCKTYGMTQIQQMGMGLLESVAKGSEQPPYLIHLIYKPKGTPKKKVALVGKGITFDTGGISIKPSAGMEAMKMDMSGAAAVLAAMKAIGEWGELDCEVHGVVAACENMPSGKASKPGDVFRAMNGKTVEVNNTDAEGRLVLADALVYAQQEAQPDEILDLATLTGACVVALGKVAAGIMGTDDGLISRVREAGEKSGEKLWQLPLYDEYKDYLKSDVADLINSGAKGEAGSQAGGMFLKEFVEKDRAWAHLDIAGPAMTNKESPEEPKGGTGFGVRTLLYYLYGLQ